MVLIDRLRGWIGGLLGGGETGADEREDDSPRLNPDNVTEVRTGGDDGAVDRLRDVKRRQAGRERDDE